MVCITCIAWRSEAYALRVECINICACTLHVRALWCACIRMYVCISTFTLTCESSFIQIYLCIEHWILSRLPTWRLTLLPTWRNRRGALSSARLSSSTSRIERTAFTISQAAPFSRRRWQGDRSAVCAMPRPCTAHVTKETRKHGRAANLCIYVSLCSKNYIFFVCGEAAPL